MTPFEYGQIKAHMHHGLGPKAISEIVCKCDGQHPSVEQVSQAMTKLRDDPSWRGERAEGSGRRRATQKSTDKRILVEVFKSRGQTKVTVPYLKKKFVGLRRLSDGTVANRLREAGLAYMRRRRKSIVTKSYVAARIAFARRVLRMHGTTLKRWAYSDGTVFYLDRTTAEHEHTQRAALGRFVWRKADCSDALYSDCIGPSGYKKSQGVPVKIWGLLANGQLHITILPEKEHMNRWWYAWIIEHYFPQWLDGCTEIVQDFEKCLRCDEPLAAFSKIGATLVHDYPKCSQDLNAIENAWRLLRERLDETLPAEVETRHDFALRLKNAVRWVNTNRYDQLCHYCWNQKERCCELLALQGGRTSF